MTLNQSKSVISHKNIIDVILRQVYREKEIVTNIPPTELKELVLLFTNNVHFSFNRQFYLQKGCYCNGVSVRNCRRFIKQNRPMLNKHGKSVPLKLFN